MTGRGAYSARLPLLTPEASALVVNGTNVGAILTHAHAQSELRAALITLGVNTQPQSIDARITRLCTGLGLAQSGVWLTDRVDGTAPPQIPPATTPDGPPPVVTPPVVPPNVDPVPSGQSTEDAAALLRRLQPQSQEQIVSPPPGFSPLVPTPSQEFAASLGMGSTTPSSGMSGFRVTPDTPPPPRLPVEADLATRVDNMVSLVRSLEPELIEIKRAYRAFMAGAPGGVPPPGFVPPVPPPYVRAAAPLATRVPTESQVWDVDQVPRKKRRTNHEVGQGLEGDSSGGEVTDAPPLDTLQGVVSIDKVCTHRGSFYFYN
jgi:hypothetical protein